MYALADYPLKESVMSRAYEDGMERRRDEYVAQALGIIAEWRPALAEELSRSVRQCSSCGRILAALARPRVRIWLTMSSVSWPRLLLAHASAFISNTSA